MPLRQSPRPAEPTLNPQRPAGPGGAAAAGDATAAESFTFDHSVLAAAATRIINEVGGINRVVCDVTSKPPGTIEWE